MDPARRKILTIADRLAPRAARMLREITSYAELSLKETRTSETLSAFLSERGFRVKRGVAGMETAFRAEFAFGKGRPVVAFLCEMDALPGLGHACGHNIVGAASACAAAALAEFGKGVFRAGKVIALGTPAEETGYGKARMVEKGVFRGIDAAMMVHPSSRRHVAKGYLALAKLHFTYHGRAAHAAAYPEHGINALDGVLLLFNGVSALRQQLPDTVRVHGIVTEGGRAPNIIPERAKAYFYVRGETLAEMRDAVARVKACAAGAATATRCRLEVEEGAYPLSPMKVNPVLADAYRRALTLLGLPESVAADEPEPRLLRHRKRLPGRPHAAAERPHRIGRPRRNPHPRLRGGDDETVRHRRDDGGDPRPRPHRVRPVLRPVPRAEAWKTFRG